MNPLIIIPARFASTRLPGKPLVDLNGKPLIQHTFEAARRTGWPVMIATDDERIEAAARGFGALACRTGECANGTERCAEALVRNGFDIDVVVNWQGDNPLCAPSLAERLLKELEAHPEADVATPVIPGDLVHGGAVSVAISSSGRALYFSRARLWPAFRHIGMYAYRVPALMAYGRQPCEIELAEDLEQLRFIDRGAWVQTVETSGPPLREVNTPQDLEIVARRLEGLNAAV